MDGLISVESCLLRGTAPPESGLGGRLTVLTPPRGGCGKELMLMVFLRVLPAAFTPGVVRNFGRLVLDPGVTGGGIPEEEGARNEDLGRRGGDSSSLLRSGVDGLLSAPLRVLVGNAGKAVVGGPYAGLEGRGMAAAMTDGGLRSQTSEDEE